MAALPYICINLLQLQLNLKSLLLNFSYVSSIFLVFGFLYLNAKTRTNISSILVVHLFYINIVLFAQVFLQYYFLPSYKWYNLLLSFRFKYLAFVYKVSQTVVLLRQIRLVFWQVRFVINAYICTYIYLNASNLDFFHTKSWNVLFKPFWKN